MEPWSHIVDLPSIQPMLRHLLIIIRSFWFELYKTVDSITIWHWISRDIYLLFFAYFCCWCYMFFQRGIHSTLWCISHTRGWKDTSIMLREFIPKSKHQGQYRNDRTCREKCCVDRKAFYTTYKLQTDQALKYSLFPQHKDTSTQWRVSVYIRGCNIFEVLEVGRMF